MEFLADGLSILSSLLGILAFFGYTRIDDFFREAAEYKAAPEEASGVSSINFRAIIIVFIASFVYNLLFDIIGSALSGDNTESLSSALSYDAMIAIFYSVIVFIGVAVGEHKSASYIGAVLGLILFMFIPYVFVENVAFSQGGLIIFLRTVIFSVIIGSMCCVIGASANVKIGALTGFVANICYGVAFVVAVWFWSINTAFSMPIIFYFSSFLIFPILGAIYGAIVGNILQKKKA